MTTKPDTLVHRANSRDHQLYGRHLSEHRKKRTKPLNFKQAMDDFQFMFPDIDRDVIETVLRANNGVVQSTIDQLLVLQESTPTDKNDNIDFPPIPSYENAIADHHDEPPPAYSAIWNDENNENSSNEEVTTASLSRAESIKQQSLLIANSYWKAPLVGSLSVDFLRIEPIEKQVNGLNIDNEESLSSSLSHNKTMTKEESNNLDEDEKLALFLQNEEFLQELRRNREFVESLESDHRKALQREKAGKSTDEPLTLTSTTESVPSGGARPRTTPPAVQDDLAFKQKLKHMGKSTKKKFSKVAKRFSRGQNGSNRPPLTHSSNSTFSLLNEEDDDIDIDDIRGIPDEPDDIDPISEESDEDKAHRTTPMRQQGKHSGTGRQLPQIGDPVTGRNSGSGETGRQLPQLPSESQLGNTEPIVFYDEDNEFEYKKE